MSEQHTPEPWRISDTSDSLILMPEAATIGAGSKYVACGGGNTAANARRIVACVNACAGISTKALEEHGLINKSPISMQTSLRIGVENFKLQSEKAELLAMLIEVRDDVDAHYDYLACHPAVNINPTLPDGCKSRLDRLDALIERMTK